jgi:hypothetical protein
MIEGDVPQCRVHTRVDTNLGGGWIRLGPCNRGCHWLREMENKKPSPLNAFLKQLNGYNMENLKNADPDKAAEHYGISRDHAAGYIRMEQERRGIRGSGGAVRNLGDRKIA